MNTQVDNLTICQVCGKTNSTGFNKPHSQHKTKRIIRPNIQKVRGQILCTRCLRTKIKKNI